MTNVHAWFSAETALHLGSCVFRKPDGSNVNVTRMDADKLSKGSAYQDERYLGEVISRADGGCVQENSRVRGITG